MIPDDIRKTWGVFKFYSMALIVLAVAVYVAFSYGNSHFAKQRAEIDTLEHTIDNLSHENQELVRRVNVIGVELEVQRLAAQRAQKVIEEGLNRESELKKELLFYQKVMAPELKQDGFGIEAIEVKPTSSEQVFWLEIVLMQQEAIKNVLKGTIELKVLGSIDGKPGVFELQQLAIDETKNLTFSFRYFQVIEQQIRLPDGFKPEQIVVKAEVYQFKRKRGELETTFPWTFSAKSIAAGHAEGE